MLALRLVYVLALSVWLGGMTILGAIVAPTIFQTLQSADPESGRALAGLAFGAMLGRFHYVAYACGALLLVSLVVIALLGPRPRHFAIRCGLIMGMLLVSLYSGFVVLGEIDAIQTEVGTLPSRLPEGDPRRVRFDELHLLSTRLMMVDLIGALALLYWEARE
ncbi:MAG TPA: DUF4149 domain-containing protein [Vicinamibacterales bacterium]|nr:DUF4149 domain-containing protein [Vicinamibacterales bacterium]